MIDITEFAFHPNTQLPFNTFGMIDKNRPNIIENVAVQNLFISLFIINEITNDPITSPKPAGIKIDKLKSASELTYSSYNPNDDNITALSTPGTIEDPATATPNITDWNKLGFVTGGNKFLLKKNTLNPKIAAIMIYM